MINVKYAEHMRQQNDAIKWIKKYIMDINESWSMDKTYIRELIDNETFDRPMYRTLFFNICAF
jgi:hypothetical protein